jgi:hypothetical protein
MEVKKQKWSSHPKMHYRLGSKTQNESAKYELPVLYKPGASETRMNKTQVNIFRWRVGFRHGLNVQCKGFSGGLFLFWRRMSLYGCNL